MASEGVIWSESLTNWLSVEARVDPKELEADVIATGANLSQDRNGRSGRY